MHIVLKGIKEGAAGDMIPKGQFSDHPGFFKYKIQTAFMGRGKPLSVMYKCVRARGSWPKKNGAYFISVSKRTWRVLRFMELPIYGEYGKFTKYVVHISNNQ